MPDTFDGYGILAQAEMRGVREKWSGPGERSQEQQQGKEREISTNLGINRKVYIAG